MRGLFIIGVCLLIAGCAHFVPEPGSHQIQKKCHSVIGSLDEYVCEQP